MNNNKHQYNYFLLLLGLSAVIMFLIFKPFLTPLVFAGSLMVFCRPLYKRIEKVLHNKSVASLLTVILVLVLILVPLLAIGSLLYEEVRTVYTSFTASGNGAGSLSIFFYKTENLLRNFAPDVTLDVSSYIQTVLKWTVEHLDSLFTGFFQIILSVMIMIIGLFFFLRDGEIIRDKMVSLSPLSNSYDEQIIKRLSRTISSVLKGSLFISLVQGFFAGLGFWALGIPNPIIWGLCAAIASLIPGIGTSLVTVPAIIFLFVTSSLWQAVALALWAALGIGMIDNFLTPYFLNKTTRIHPLLILISVLGGIGVFGPVGFLMGPIMLAFFLSLIEIYPLIFKEQ